MNLPVDLADNAAKYLGSGNLTEAVRGALRDALHRQSCMNLLAMRGKFDPEIDLESLRRDD